MRTTLTIDKDVAVQIERMRQEENVSLKEVVNRLLRQGLQAGTDKKPRTQTIRTKTVDLGRCLIGSIDDVAEALSLGEGEGFR